MDIREFYDAGGEEKPGKKGIALSPEQVHSSFAGADCSLTVLTVGGSEGERRRDRLSLCGSAEEKEVAGALRAVRAVVLVVFTIRCIVFLYPMKSE